MIDIGVNLANGAFAADRAAVIERARAAGVEAMIITGTSIEESRSAVALADPAARLYATAGVHPHEAGSVAEGWLHQLAALAERPAVVAIGETGLDFYRDYSPRPAQRRVFRAQVELAVRTGKPLFVHDRDSGGETLAILGDYRGELGNCVIHCFTGTEEDLAAYLAAGYSIGITGWICDEWRGGELAALVRDIPPDRLMIETDAPFLLPRTMRPRPPSRRNEPAFLPYVAARLAECRGEEETAIRQLTHDNAERFFALEAHQ